METQSAALMRHLDKLGLTTREVEELLGSVKVVLVKDAEPDSLTGKGTCCSPQDKTVVTGLLYTSEIETVAVALRDDQPD